MRYSCKENDKGYLNWLKWCSKHRTRMQVLIEGVLLPHVVTVDLDKGYVEHIPHPMIIDEAQNDVKRYNVYSSKIEIRPCPSH